MSDYTDISLDKLPSPEVTESWTAKEILRWAELQFGDRIAIASAFGAEGIVVIDIASGLWRPRVFVLDTEFLFPETYRLIQQVEQRYGITIERVRSALTPEVQSRIHGPQLWQRDPDLCCQLRKIEPLQRKLAGLEAWVTSVRRDQTPERACIRKIGHDPRFGVVKINPLADWSREQVWAYVRAHRLPYNPLHDRAYPSIGCTHCTRPIQPGEDHRAGRWPGFAKRECGLHAQNSRTTNETR